ncbi:hypothetical protein [Dyella sp.]|uniref:hypothetical protein n=1 Tax=Dyella sp. TaxID=1869338 RepID=UPI002D797E0F|nr:hypothetical protein [Dyella sp.]HET6430730.1 hypothetical protein [Dyella sp.]
MQKFIPLEDDWALIEALFDQRLVPYVPGMPCAHTYKEDARNSLPAASGPGAAADAKGMRENLALPPSQGHRTAL